MGSIGRDRVVVEGSHFLPIFFASIGNLYAFHDQKFFWLLCSRIEPWLERVCIHTGSYVHCGASATRVKKEKQKQTKYFIEPWYERGFDW